jgi:hypothetical protein
MVRITEDRQENALISSDISTSDESLNICIAVNSFEYQKKYCISNNPRTNPK